MSRTRSARIIKILAFSFVSFALLSSLLAALYLRAIDGSCAADPACSPKPSFWPNGIFYAAQTITTTGYGTGVAVHLEGVQALSNFSMPIAALYWGVLISLVFEGLKADKVPTERPSGGGTRREGQAAGGSREQAAAPR